MAKSYDIDEQLKALADPVRMRVIKLLALPVRSRSDEEHNGLCGCDVESVMGVGQSTVSHHMKLLTKAGLVTTQKKGRWVYYRLDREAFAFLSAALARFAGSAAVCVAADDGGPEGAGQAGAGCCAAAEPPPDAVAPEAAPPPASKRLRVVGRNKQA